MKSRDEIQIPYEISLSIGVGLQLDHLLDEAVSAMMNLLGCSGARVLQAVADGVFLAGRGCMESGGGRAPGLRGVQRPRFAGLPRCNAAASDGDLFSGPRRNRVYSGSGEEGYVYELLGYL